MLAIAGVTAGVATAGFIGVGAASAATTSSTSTNSVSSLVSAIAKKFNLKTSDVQAVFDADRTERQAERLAENSTRLQSLVDKGTITADQKTKIEAKQKELQTKRDAERTELEKWATDNGIDAKYLMGGGMGRGGKGGPMGDGPMNDAQN
jgi:uncharacterized membrane protein YhiD involved in acid resistance